VRKKNVRKGKIISLRKMMEEKVEREMEGAGKEGK